MVLRHFSIVFCFSLFCCNVYLSVSDSDEQSIFDQTETINQIVIVNMLKN